MFELLEHKNVHNYDVIQQVCKEIGEDGLLEHLQIPTYVLLMALRHKASGKLLAIGWFIIC